MNVVFHENALLLSTYKFIVIPIKYRNCGPFVYDSAQKQMLSATSLVIEQRKNEFDSIAKVMFSPIYFYACEGDITFRTPASREGDITGTQTLLISFKPITCKLSYSHVIIQVIVYHTFQNILHQKRSKSKDWKGK